MLRKQTCTTWEQMLNIIKSQKRNLFKGYNTVDQKP